MRFSASDGTEFCRPTFSISRPRGVIGYHPAALPHNRGRHPIIWALARGLTQTASTFFLMDEGADTGAIVDQEPVPIGAHDDAGRLYARLQDMAIHKVEVVPEAPENLEPGKILSVDPSGILVKCGEGAVHILEHDFDSLPQAGQYL